MSWNTRQAKGDRDKVAGREQVTGKRRQEKRGMDKVSWILGQEQGFRALFDDLGTGVVPPSGVLAIHPGSSSTGHLVHLRENVTPKTCQGPENVTGNVTGKGHSEKVTGTRWPATGGMKQVSTGQRDRDHVTGNR